MTILSVFLGLCVFSHVIAVGLFLWAMIHHFSELDFTGQDVLIALVLGISVICIPGWSHYVGLSAFMTVVYDF